VILPDLHDCQCPFCKSATLGLSCRGVPDATQIYDNGIVCSACGQGFDLVWGVPFLGVFEEADVLSLIEIAANADNYKRDSTVRNGMSSGTAGVEYARWHDLLDRYHLSADRYAFLASEGVSAEVSSWFPNRYGEHVLFRSMTAGLDLAGKDVLDVGAGAGFDSFKFVRAGSHVTCFEFSPILAHEGLQKVPQGRWIGGSSRVLPFSGSAFDVVVANAALHHIRDIPATIGEMLRVLKPGGYLLTLCDSYRKNNSGEEVEVGVFRDNVTVLMGVNEGIPPLGDFLSTLVKHRDQLDIHIFTSEVHGVQYDLLTRKLKLPKVGKLNMLHPKEWPLDEALELLPTTSGGLALLVQLKRPVRGEEARPAPSVIRPAAFARSLDNQASATAELAEHLPSQFVDLPLLDQKHTKFRLLNGWKPSIPKQSYRTAYRRARAFQKYPAGAEVLRVSILAPHIERVDRPSVELLVNGRLIAARKLCRGLWTEYVAPVDHVARGSVAAIEVRMDTSVADEQAKIFHVRELGFGHRAPGQDRSEADLQHYGLEALAEIGLLRANPARVLLSNDYSLAIATLNRLRAIGFGAEVIVEKGQERFFISEPDVKVIGTYNDRFAIEDSRGRTLPEDIMLIVAPDEAEVEALLSLFPASSRRSDRFAVLPGGHAYRCRSLFHSIPGWRGAIRARVAMAKAFACRVFSSLKGLVKQSW
jgi:ubiquinone/menaquinone biosynthesis C-methylase UbiE